MLSLLLPRGLDVNRHTGGLETVQGMGAGIEPVNRHTGGLETKLRAFNTLCFVNRHTGGLESQPI